MKKFLKNKYFVTFFISIILLIVGSIIVLNYPKQTQNPGQQKIPSEPNQDTITTTTLNKVITEPVSNATTRVTKKPFGIYITPQTSPVQSEKFSGYHTGTDFETTPQEANADVSVSAVCSGKIRVKQTVSGYGGVIIQDCTIENQVVTVLYGHLNIGASSVPAVSAEIKSGDKIGFLAPANSVMSGGERKHLHLGIHNGTAIDYRGYVQNQSELSSWLDVQKHL